MKKGVSVISIFTLDQLPPLSNKRVLLRVDYNVPIQNGKVSDATRIAKSAPTITRLLDAGAKVILLSHLGRPDGKVMPEFSLAPLLPEIEKFLGGKVLFSPDCVGDNALSALRHLKAGEILLLENLRFHAGEEKNDPAFATQLAALGDIYVNDAFSAAHRKHASTYGLARLLPCAGGILMQQEIEALSCALENPARPAMAVVGGSKVSSKIDVLNNILPRVDVLAIGGGMANTFLLAQGMEIGKSFCDRESADVARAVMQKAKEMGKEILLPIDAACAPELKPNALAQYFPANAIPKDQMILDIGPDTAKLWAEKITRVKTILWNGPLGVFETPPFDAGTNAVAKAVAKSTKSKTLLSVAGGGDTVAALESAGVVQDFSFVSTAGGAFLEWIEGKELPGVAALRG